MALADAHGAAFDITIEAGRPNLRYWIDLWRYRELFLVLAWRDLSVRYKQTVIGITWAVLQPFLTMIVLTVVFSRVAGLRAEGGAPYAIMVFAAMLPWLFFSTAMAAASQSLVTNANLISKVYFPRLIVPVSAIATSFADLLVSFLVLVGIMWWYRFAPSTTLVALPVFVAFVFLAALGPGLLLAALNVKYRDFRYVVPFLVQFGLYVSPVGFSANVVRDKLGEAGFLLYSLNPMVGVIDAFRWAILGRDATLDLRGLAVSITVVLAALVAGVWYFRKTERRFADIV